jgi:PAS domain S-box-containing protein
VTRASKDVLVEYDDRGTITFVSANVERIPGRVASEIVGHNIAEFFVENISNGVIELLQKKRRLDADDVDGEVHLARGLVPAHADRWYESTTGSYRTPAGELRFVARVRDVSERIAGKVRIRENEARLVRAERIANVGSWEWRPQGDHLIWSDQMTRMHGLEPNEAESDRELLFRLMIPEDREPFRQCIQKAVDERVGFETDYRIRRPGEDETRTLHVQGELDLDGEGRVTKMAGTTVDVTARVRMNEALRIGEERFRMLFDSNVVGVFYIEADGHIREANNALLDLIGYGKADLPISWEELTPPDRLPRSMEAREELRNGMGAAPYETEFVRATGDRVPVLITGARIGEQDAIVLALDLSEQKNAEQQIARYQRELEKRELVDSQNRLVETQRLAAIGTLAAGVAHQINNPVGAILNSAEYALLCKDDDDAASIFERALRDNLAEARRCAQIVRSILQFSTPASDCASPRRRSSSR